MEKQKKWPMNIALYVLTCVGLSGYFIVHTSALLNSGLFSALLLTLMAWYWERQQQKRSANPLWSRINCLWQSQLVLMSCISVFILWLLLSSLFFSYGHDTTLTLVALYKDVRYPLLFGIIFIFCARHVGYPRVLLLSLLVILFGLIVLKPLQATLTNQLSVDARFYGQQDTLHLYLRYLLDAPITVLYPFALISFLEFRHWVMRAIGLLLITGTFTFVIYSGSRGNFGVLLVETLLFCLLLRRHMAISWRRLGLFLLPAFMVISIIFVVLFIQSPLIQRKVHSGFTNTSGRITLIKTRYPLIMSTMGTYVHGIGYGNQVYQQLLQQKKAPKIVGVEVIKGKQTYYSYFHDEPQLLVVFYESGIIGLLCFITWIATLLLQMYRYISLATSHGRFILGLFIAVIGNTLFEGVFEHTGIGFPLLLSMMFFSMVVYHQTRLVSK